VVTCVKIAEPIVMQFVLWGRSATRNHEIDRGPDPPTRSNFAEKGPPL